MDRLLFLLEETDSVSVADERRMTRPGLLDVQQSLKDMTVNLSSTPVEEASLLQGLTTISHETMLDAFVNDSFEKLSSDDDESVEFGLYVCGDDGESPGLPKAFSYDELLGEDDEKLAEAAGLLNLEKRRLEKIIHACDKLKQETVSKVSLQPFGELGRYKDTLRALRRDLAEVKKKRQDETMGKRRSEVEKKISALHQNITLAYQNLQSKKNLQDCIHDSLVSVGFVHTSLEGESKKDEIVINFARDDKFPPGLFITCCMLQDMFHQCMMHDGVGRSKNHSSDCGPKLLSPISPETPSSSPSSFTQTHRTHSPTTSTATAVLQSDPVGATTHSTVIIGSPAVDAPGPGSTKAWGGVSEVTSFAEALKTSGSPEGMPAVSLAAPTGNDPVPSYSKVSQLHCPPQLPRPEKTVAETNRPHCFFDIRIRGFNTVRVVIRVRPDKAPFMSENFIQLCLGKKGISYKGCKFFRGKPDGHVLCGDFESQDGSGGHSSFAEAPLFLAEQCSLRDQKGAVRMRGMERTAEGRCKVGSQFMVWVGDINYKEYKYTLVFGEVTAGLSHLKDISRIGMVFTSKSTWVLKEEAVIINCGVI